MKFGNIFVGKRLWVGFGEPKALGEGEEEIRGSSYIEGPLEVGDDAAFDAPIATVMIGPELNTDVENHATRSLHVKGNTMIEGNLLTPFALNVVGNVTILGNTIQAGNTNQTGSITATGTITANNFVGSVSSASGKSSGAKSFDIPHPTKDGYRLRYVCLEGPETAVYCRGRVNNRNNVITLPEYWDGLVNYDSMTVQLTPIHSHQNVIVKRIDVNQRKIYLQAQGGMPVDCFYHIMAERKDIEKLIPEYEGKTSDDYPGDNSIYSINK